jgi:hypothetical protein
VPQHVRDRPFAHQPGAVQHVGVRAELLGRVVVDAGPVRRVVEAVDRGVAVFVVQRGEQLDPADASGRLRRRRTAATNISRYTIASEGRRQRVAAVEAVEAGRAGAAVAAAALPGA